MLKFHEVEYWVDPPGTPPPVYDPDFFLSYWKGDRNRKVRIKALNRDAALGIAEFHMKKLQGEKFTLQRKINWSIGFSFYIVIGEWEEGKEE